MTAGCGRRGAEPKPSCRAGTAAFSLPFELPQLPGAAVPLSTDWRSWGGGAQWGAAQGARWGAAHVPPTHCRTDPLPGLSPSTPASGQRLGSGHRSGASGSYTGMGHRSFGFARLLVTPSPGEGVGRGCCQGPASTGLAGEASVPGGGPHAPVTQPALAEAEVG